MLPPIYTHRSIDYVHVFTYAYESLFDGNIHTGRQSFSENDENLKTKIVVRVKARLQTNKTSRVYVIATRIYPRTACYVTRACFQISIRTIKSFPRAHLTYTRGHTMYLQRAS